ncbi:hypothetical protein IF1G_02110 [Cordyceps javanica]|uniref:Uncharacterized protein n=1 Tax=Cordyceps javanica TaxID=43265 RepID=A0A545VDU6_9HYPO|nr:hypothetical protein IF1G_02110 [Cordyceps javanica]
MGRMHCLLGFLMPAGHRLRIRGWEAVFSRSGTSRSPDDTLRVWSTPLWGEALSKKGTEVKRSLGRRLANSNSTAVLHDGYPEISISTVCCGGIRDSVALTTTKTNSSQASFVNREMYKKGTRNATSKGDPH